MRYLLTGDEFNAEEALRIGIVQQVTTPDEHIAGATELAETIVAQAPLGVQAILASTHQAITEREEAPIQQHQPESVRLLQSADAIVLGAQTAPLPGSIRRKGVSPETSQS